MQYCTPNMGGFTARIAYGANEERDATANPNLLSAAVMYRGGPLYVSFAHDIHKDYGGAGLTDSGSLFGATYAFGDTKVGFVFESLEYETGAGATTKRDAQSVTIAQKIGSGIIRAAYTLADDSSGNGAAVGSMGAPSGANDTGAKQTSLGYGHVLSKRTELYAHYTKIDNEAGALYNLANAPFPAVSFAAGMDPQVIGFGIVHRF